MAQHFSRSTSLVTSQFFFFIFPFPCKIVDSGGVVLENVKPTCMMDNTTCLSNDEDGVGFTFSFWIKRDGYLAFHGEKKSFINFINFIDDII